VNEARLARRSLGEICFNVVNYLVFGLFVFLCVFPFYYIFINTISDNQLASTGKILLLPKGIHFANYVAVFKLRGLGHAAFISVSRTILGTVLTLVGSSFLAYAFTKKELWKRKLWYRFLIITMYFNAGLIPWYVTMKMLGMTNNYWAYVLPGTVVAFYVILLKTFMEQIPSSMEESAQVDGAGYVMRFSRIIMPLSLPILATIAIFSSVGQWNSFMDTVFLMRSSRLYTLQYLLFQYLSEANALAILMRSSPRYQNLDLSRMLSPLSIRMTITIVVVFPIMVVYPFFQRYYVTGIMIGAVKG
jgi:putative aldouronate transport system permease protein